MTRSTSFSTKTTSWPSLLNPRPSGASAAPVRSSAVRGFRLIWGGRVLPLGSDGSCQGDASPERSVRPTVPDLRSAFGPRSSLAALGTPWPLGPPHVRLRSRPATEPGDPAAGWVGDGSAGNRRLPAHPPRAAGDRNSTRHPSRRPLCRTLQCRRQSRRAIRRVQPAEADFSQTTARLSEATLRAAELRAGPPQPAPGTRRKRAGAPGAPRGLTDGRLIGKIDYGCQTASQT